MRMLSKMLLNRLRTPLAEGVEASAAGLLNVPELAEQYGVSLSIMEGFLCRFAPSKVAEGRYKAEADTMLFVHIPKTAGVSVGKRAARG